MGFNTTTRLAIRHPDLAQAADFQVILNNLANDIDAKAVGFYTPAVIGSRPAAGVGDMIFWSTDTKQLFFDDGSTWQNVSGGPLNLNTQGSSYTLVLADAGRIVEMNNASPLNLTVPPNSSVAFPIGTSITIVQVGAGQITVVAGAGVTLRTNPGAKLSGQWAMAAIYKRNTDEWVLGGNIIP